MTEETPRDYYKIVNHRTKETVSHGLTRQGAYRKADKLDQDYGAVAHGVHLMTPKNEPWFNKWTKEQMQQEMMRRASEPQNTMNGIPIDSDGKPTEQIAAQPVQNTPSVLPGMAKALPIKR